MATDSMFMTADQLLVMPDDGFRYELIRGELIQMSPAGGDHSSRCELFNVYIGHHIATHRLGMIYAAETGFLLAQNPDTVRAPDFAFIRQERLAQITRAKGCIPIPPDLCTEVMSPDDRPSKVMQKVSDWLDFGTGIVIVIDPAKRSTSVYRSHADVETLTEHDTLRLEDVLPGWSLSLAEIFR